MTTPSLRDPDQQIPRLVTVAETAVALRTSRKAIYSMIERGLLPGVVRIGRRVLVDAAILVHWIRQSRAPSPKE